MHTSLISENTKKILGLEANNFPQMKQLIESAQPILEPDEEYITSDVVRDATDSRIHHMYYVTDRTIFYDSFTFNNRNQTFDYCNTPMKSIFLHKMSTNFNKIIKQIVPFLNSPKPIQNINDFFITMKQRLNGNAYLKRTTVRINEPLDLLLKKQNIQEPISHKKRPSTNIIKLTYNDYLANNEAVIIEGIYYGDINTTHCVNGKFSSTCYMYGITSNGNIILSKPQTDVRGRSVTIIEKIENNIKLPDACIEILEYIVPYVQSIEPINRVIKLCKNYSKLWYCDSSDNSNTAHVSDSVSVPVEQLYVDQTKELNNLRNDHMVLIEKYNKLVEEMENTTKEFDDYKEVLRDTIRKTNVIKL